MSNTNSDIIDQLIGIEASSPLVELRARRPVTKEQSQASWKALFEPTSVSDVSLSERFAVALFVSLLHHDAKAATYYEQKLATQDNGAAIAEVISALANQDAAIGPYGDYPAGPLSAENQSGPSFIITNYDRELIGQRLAAALEHTHFLVFHPRDAKPARLQKLLDAGWSTTGIVTLSQLVSFLAFQLRVISGLKVLASA